MSTGTGNPEWHRISPVAVVFILFQAIRQVGFNSLPALVVLLAAFGSGGTRRKAFMLSLLPMAVLLGVVFSVLYWMRFRFRVTGDRVLVRSGVFKREELSVEFDRIQNVSIREPFYMRPFGLSVLSIDTAGSSQKEIQLGGISKELAMRLREQILAGATSVKAGEKESVGEPEHSRLLLSRSSRDIVIYGLTVNFFIWVAIALGAVFGGWDTTEQVVAWITERFQLNDAITMAQGSGDFLANVLLIGGLVIAALLLLPLISVAGALIRHHGYRLTVEGETYSRAGGFLTRHEESLKRHKIQAMVLKKNPVARLFDRTNLQLRVASAGSGMDSGQLPIGSKAQFLVPVLHPSELALLSEEFLPDCDLAAVRYSRTDRRRLTWVVVGLATAVVSPASIALGLVVSWKFLAIPLLTLLLAWLGVSLYWRKTGYAVVGDYGYIRHGIIGIGTTVFPLFKVQRIDIQQTPGMRRRGLADLNVHLASHSLTVRYMDAGDAEKFRDLVLYHVESSDRAWF